MPPRHVALACLAAAVCTALSPAAASAQVRVGPRVGASLSAKSDDVGTFRFDARDFRLSVDDIAAGFHAGLFVQARLGERFVIQPELLFHSTRTDYLLEELLSTETIGSIRSEKVASVELPLLVAYRWRAFRLQAGPVGRARVAQSSELTGVAGYRDDPEREDVAFGYQAGLGVDLKRFLFDVKYDGRFDDNGATVDIGGQRLALSRRASRTYVTLGYALFGKKS